MFIGRASSVKRPARAPSILNDVTALVSDYFPASETTRARNSAVSYSRRAFEHVPGTYYPSYGPKFSLVPADVGRARRDPRGPNLRRPCFRAVSRLRVPFGRARKNRPSPITTINSRPKTNNHVPPVVGFTVALPATCRRTKRDRVSNPSSFFSALTLAVVPNNRRVRTYEHDNIAAVTLQTPCILSVIVSL